MPNFVTYQTLTDLSPFRGTRLIIQIYYVYCTEWEQHSAVEFICYAWLSDSDANLFVSYPSNDAMNSDLLMEPTLLEGFLVLSKNHILVQ